MNTKEILKNSSVAFGTSGARGLVTDFTPQVCAAFAHAFISVVKKEFQFKSVAVGIDNRPSSYAMAQACCAAIAQAGFEPVYYGVLPTPALAFKAMQDEVPCIMVTGSHIPFDRNGLKFYRPDGEITKADELAINGANVDFELSESQELVTNTSASELYNARYTSIFDKPFLIGKKIGIYEHSSAGRDLYSDIFTALGAEVTALERSDEFVPIDTEAVSEEDKEKARAWSKKFGFDAIFSTDGDGDRPLIADEKGEWLRGDVLGLLTAKAMGIEALAVPVSCNTAIEKSELFKQVLRTKIGSPYVIAEFDSLAKEFRSVAGFEANGGFLLGSDSEVSGQTVKALPTRDAVLPAIMLLALAKGSSVSQQVAQLPSRFTASDRIKNFATEQSKAIIQEFKDNSEALLAKLELSETKVVSTDLTDGLRMTLESGNVVHLRPSGNAPELRCYAESVAEHEAENLVKSTLSQLQVIYS